MSMDRTRVLAEMGVKPVWKLRQPAAAPASTPVMQAPTELVHEALQKGAATPTAAPAASSVATMEWETLANTVAECRACGLCTARKQTVFGVGDRQAEWMFVGEGPGAEEDLRGEPFVGQAGKLLDAMLEASGLARSKNVYIANAVKCRPPGNRTPEANEIAACRPYLERQIALVKPKLLIALGRPAAQTLLGSEMSISSARGRLHRYGEIPVVVTYHPAYLLRNLPDKAKAWVDMCFAADTLSRSRGGS